MFVTRFFISERVWAYVKWMVRRANVTQNINDVKILVDKAMASVQPPYWDKCFGNNKIDNCKQTADM